MTTRPSISISATLPPRNPVPSATDASPTTGLFTNPSMMTQKRANHGSTLFRTAGLSRPRLIRNSSFPLSMTLRRSSGLRTIHSSSSSQQSLNISAVKRLRSLVEKPIWCARCFILNRPVPFMFIRKISPSWSNTTLWVPRRLRKRARLSSFFCRHPHEMFM